MVNPSMLPAVGGFGTGALTLGSNHWNRVFLEAERSATDEFALIKARDSFGRTEHVATQSFVERLSRGFNYLETAAVAFGSISFDSGEFDGTSKVISLAENSTTELSLEDQTDTGHVNLYNALNDLLANPPQDVQPEYQNHVLLLDSQVSSGTATALSCLYDVVKETDNSITMTLLEEDQYEDAMVYVATGLRSNIVYLQKKDIDTALEIGIDQPLAWSEFSRMGNYVGKDGIIINKNDVFADVDTTQGIVLTNTNGGGQIAMNITTSQFEFDASNTDRLRFRVTDVLPFVETTGTTEVYQLRTDGTLSIAKNGVNNTLGVSFASPNVEFPMVYGLHADPTNDTERSVDGIERGGIALSTGKLAALTNEITDQAYRYGQAIYSDIGKDEDASIIGTSRLTSRYRTSDSAQEMAMQKMLQAVETLADGAQNPLTANLQLTDGSGTMGIAYESDSTLVNANTIVQIGDEAIVFDGLNYSRVRVTGFNADSPTKATVDALAGTLQVSGGADNGNDRLYVWDDLQVWA